MIETLMEVPRQTHYKELRNIVRGVDGKLAFDTIESRSSANGLLLYNHTGMSKGRNTYIVSQLVEIGSIR